MPIPNTILNYLDQNEVEYQVIKHQHSSRSYESSQFAHVDANKVAKAILLKSKDDYVLAVLPANLSIDMYGLREEYGSQIEMAQEHELGSIFPDCELGAIPAIGEVYGIDTIIDTKLLSLPEVYFEAGDHERLIKVSEPDFEKMLPNAHYNYISKDWE